MKRILTILLTILVMYVPVFADQVSYAYDNAGNRIKREIVIDTRVVDESGNAVERMSYDAWGNLRDPQTHKVYEAGKAPGLMLGRGYTGHEHLPWFGLVNMNARLYDPALGRFLSPDPYVQSECGPQGFNRYSYCLNNPLLYIDEDGEMPLLLAGALLGGCVNLVYKACSGQIHSAGDAFAAFGIGAVAGLAGTVTGGWAAGLAGGGFFAGAAAGGIGAATDMYLQSLGNHAYFGEPIISTKDLLIGTAFEAITAGAINGSVAASEGKNFWTGEMIAEGKGIFSFNNPTKTSIPLIDSDGLDYINKPLQRHHFATNKNKKFTPLFEKIVK